ncbi:MAG TPA: radical SAM/Cys-rich domain protein [Gammaproteobacteria bacterium]|nr:radical SAM/Cys-rich domain protein [Gammaproteobacteria bacterium]
MHATLPLLENSDFPAIKRLALQTVQVNLGYRCNQQCLHCHVNAGPGRKENMDRKTIDQVLDFAFKSGANTLDLTGGAPELNPHFRALVKQARSHGLEVIDRCNLTILLEPGQEDLAKFLASQTVQIVASLPCYLEENVDRQRGKGTFESSIQALQRLNQLGYGMPGNKLSLNLVYNPQDDSLPPDQLSLEKNYHRHLRDNFNVEFNHLFALANMPIKRFGSTLISKGRFGQYMQLIRDAHQDKNLSEVMCRSLISIDWRGYVYDCDFNQMLNLPIHLNTPQPTHISELDYRHLQGQPVRVADHCYACTAGQGSSCGGALDD